MSWRRNALSEVDSEGHQDLWDDGEHADKERERFKRRDRRGEGQAESKDSREESENEDEWTTAYEVTKGCDQ